jgi:ribosomal protein S18 acetylase RimI-like enzyme
MAGNYDIHALTLAQVASLLRLDGTWPGPLTLTSGWFRARARPWNDTVPDPMVRLERGGADFLRNVTTKLMGLGVSDLYSPALYPDASRVWRKASYGDHASLAVMERSLGIAPRPGPREVRQCDEPDWDAVVEVDMLAFEGFWGMSRLGLSEAHETNRTTTLLTCHEGDTLVGYAVVGAQWGVTYLHRIAVRPSLGGNGYGASLLSAAIGWGTANNSRSMVLNVRSDNTRALKVYERAGFTMTGTNLLILRHPGR